MGRAGAGGGGGFSSGGGHSMGHSTGGHSMGSHSRPSGGSSSHSRAGGGGSFSHSGGGAPHGGGYHGGGFGGYDGGFHEPPHQHHVAPPPPEYFGVPHPPMGDYIDRLAPPPPPRRRRHYDPIISIGSCIIVFLIILIAMFGGTSGGSSTKSTINREKLTGYAWNNDCIIDEIGWFDNVTKTEKQLKSFWEDTGIQPMIILRAYDASLTTESAKQAWSTAYYDNNITEENVFLFVYFAEADQDGEVGYMTYTNGIQTSSVMDSEAIEIFFNYLDKYWVTNMSTDDVFITTFDKTADTIMKVSTTGADVAKALIIGLVVIIILVIAYSWWKNKRKAEKERAEETERILNTPMETLVQDRADELTKKYD